MPIPDPRRPWFGIISIAMARRLARIADRELRELLSTYLESWWKMHPRWHQCLVAALLAGSTTGYQPASTAKTDVLAADALTLLAKYASQNPSGTPCTLENAARRREW